MREGVHVFLEVMGVYLMDFRQCDVSLDSRHLWLLLFEDWVKGPSIGS